MSTWIPDNPIVGIERILNWMQDRKCAYFTIYDSDREDSDSSKGRKKIATNTDTTDDLETGIRRLKGVLNDYVEGLTGYLWVKPAKEGKAGGFYTCFKIYSTNGVSREPVNPIASIGSIDDLKNQIRSEILKDIEHDNLKKEVLELKEQNKNLQPGIMENVVNDIWGTIKPFAPVIAKQMFLANPASVISGNRSDAKSTDTDNHTDDKGSNEEEKAHKLQLALERLYAKDPEIVGKLEKLADLQENDPDTYEQATSMLDTLS